MKKIYALALLIGATCATPALAGPVHKHHVASHRRPHATIQIGTASWYGRRRAGLLTANGERFDPEAMTCAHRTLPFGSMVKVTDIASGKHVSLKVNDRGPYVSGRIVDLSEGAARELGVGNGGLMIVRVEVVSVAQPEESG
jgi:rare lipoprotein A